MSNKSKLELQMALNTPIVAQNVQLSSSENLVKPDIEAYSSAELWSGRVSLDSQKYQTKPSKGDIAGISNRIAKGTVDIDEDTLIEAIISGQTWSPTIFYGKRDRNHFEEMWALGVDFDEGFKSLEEILQRAEEHGLKFSFIHKTFSHTPDRPKYRGVILLSQPIKKYEKAKSYCQYLKHVFQGMVDKGAAEPTRLFFGGQAEAIVHHNQGHAYDLSWLEDKTSSFQKDKQALRKPKKVVEISKYQKHQLDNPEIPSKYEINYESLAEGDTQHLQKIMTCLGLIPTEYCDDQGSWFEITAALKYEALNNSSIESEIEQIWDEWSANSDNYDRDENYSRWNSLTDTADHSISLGTVIKQYCGGWDRVQKHIEKLFPKLDPYLVDESKSGTFQVCLAKLLERKGYIAINENCYRWVDTHWSFVNDGEMKTYIAKESTKFYQLTKNKGKKYSFGTSRHTNNGLEFFKSFHNQSSDNISNSHLIAFDNGTLDIRTGVLSSKHEKSDYLTFKIVGDYIEEAELPEVGRNFFISTFGEELIPYIRAIFRMYLSPNFPYGKFVHIIGASGSGKGTFIRLLLSMLSPASVGSGNDLTCFDKPDKVMQQLSGKAIYALPDMSTYTTNCTGFYELVDNGILSGRNLYSSHTVAQRWKVRFIVASVNPLKTGSSSDGWSRRVLQLPTKKREGKPDIHLEKNLINVKAQIASWALQMPKEEAIELIWNADTNEIINQSTLEASVWSDPIKQFLDQCVTLTGRNDNLIPISELYQHYTIFCNDKNYKALAMNTFSSAVQSDLNHLYQQRTTIKKKRVPSSIRYVKLIPDLYSIRGLYQEGYETEGNFGELLKFQPENMNTDPNYAQIETAILFEKEYLLNDIGKIPPQDLSQVLNSFDELKLNEAQQNILVKIREKLTTSLESQSPELKKDLNKKNIRYSTENDLQEISSWTEEDDEHSTYYHDNISMMENDTEGNPVLYLGNHPEILIKNHRERKLLVCTDSKQDKPIGYLLGEFESSGILQVKVNECGEEIATALVEYRINELRDNNKGCLLVADITASSVSFWERMGFRILTFSKSKFSAYQLLERKNDLPKNGVDVSVKVSVYPEERKYDENIPPITTFTPRAVQTLDRVIHLEERISFFNEIKYIHEGSNNLVISIHVDDTEIYFDKAKYPEAKELGVCRFEGCDYAFYLDYISKQDRTIAHPRYSEKFGIVLV